MEEIYEYNGKEYSRAQLESLASESGVGFGDYINAIGAKLKQQSGNGGVSQNKRVSEKYIYNNKEYSFDQLNGLAQESGVSFEDYTRALGIKKKDGGAKSADGGGVSPQLQSESLSESANDNADPFAAFNPSLGKKNPKLESAKRLQNLNSTQARTVELNTDKITSVLSQNGIGIDQLATVPIPKQLSMFLPSIEGKTFGEVANTNEGRLAMAKAAKAKIQEDIYNIEQGFKEGVTAPKGMPTNKFATPTSLQQRNVISAEDRKLISEKRKELEEIDKIEQQISDANVEVTDETRNAVVRVDKSGNSLKMFGRLIQKMASFGSPLMGVPAPDFELKVSELPETFVMGLEYLSYKEPVEAERLIAALNNGEPISDSQKSIVINHGLRILKNRVDNLRANGQLSDPEYNAELQVIDKKTKENIYSSPEVLRAFLSNEIAERADADMVKMDDLILKSGGSVAPNIGSSKFFGHRWNYTDDEIALYASAFARENGLDENDKRFKAAVKYLQDNEGAWIGANSIYKAGWVRDFGEGLLRPVMGTLQSAEALLPQSLGGRSMGEIYAQGQSQGSVQVAKQPVKRIENSWEGSVSKIFEGAGEIISQIALTKGYGGVMGGALRQSAKDFLSTTIMAFGQSYDGNLKQALTYTDDNALAVAVAGGLSSLEGIVENIKSPISVGRDIKNIFRGEKTTSDIIGVLSNDKILDKRTAVADYLKATLRGVLKTGKVAGGEITEETITQLADYGANYMLNGSSQSFQDRNLGEEIFNTAVETGLTMTIPALIAGVGAYNASNFEKGTLLLAAQNRKKILDELELMKSNGRLTDDEYNQKVSIVNTASKINNEIPLKANNKKLNSEEKANYIYSRTSEALLEKKMQESSDVAEKEILQEKIKQQQNFRKQILQTDENAENAINETEQQTTETKNIQTEVADSEVATTATITENLAVGDVIRNKTGDIGRVREVTNESVVVEGLDNPNMSFTWSKNDVDATSQYELREQTINDKISRLENELSKIEDDNNPRIAEIDTEISQLENQRENVNKVNVVIDKVNKNESINENDLFDAAVELENVVNQSNNPSVSNLINPIINKLLSHENITKTETRTVTQEGAVSRIGTDVATREVSKRLDQWQGQRVTTTDSRGNEITGILNKDENGSYSIFNESGEKVLSIGEAAITDRDISLPPLSENPNPIEFDADGNVAAITLQLNEVDLERGGLKPTRTIKVQFDNAEQGLDYAIQLRAEQVGEFTDAEFEQIVNEVTQEVPIQNTQNVQRTEGTNVTETVSEPVQSNEQTTEGQAVEGAIQQDTPPMERGTTETANAVLRKSLADRIREGKINDDIAMSGVPFLKEDWNGALEAVALSIEAGDSLRKSINKGLSYIRNSDWYKGLTDEHKTRAENRFRDEYDDLVGDLIDTTQKIGNKEVDDAIDSIVATGAVNDYLSGDTIEKRTSERPTSNQQYNSTVLEDAFKQGIDVIEAAKEAYGKEYVSKLLDYLKNTNMDVGKKALIYVSLRNDLYLRRLQATPEQYQSVVKEQEAVYLQSQDFAHQNAIAMNMWRLQNIQKYGYDINEITEKLFTPTENEQRAKVSKAIQVNDDAVNKEADINSDSNVGSKDPDIAKEAEEEKAKPTKDNRKRSSKNKWKSRKVSPEKLNEIIKSVKEKINKLNCK